MFARRFGYLFIAFWLVFAGAVAQAQTNVAGSWDVQFRWHDGAQQEGAFTIELARGGTWRNNYSETGTWRVSGDYFTLRYDVFPNSEYRGTISGNSITGVITNARGESGSFTLSRGGGGGDSSSSSGSSAFVGRWTGSTDWAGTDYDSTGAWWDFRSSGVFIDNNGDGGDWSANGNRITFQYIRPNGTRGSTYTATRSGDSLSGTMTNGEISGTFSLRRSGGVLPAFIGRFAGSTDWPGSDYDSSNAWWDFGSDGTFYDNNGDRGDWTASGNRITFQYIRANGTRGSTYTGTLSGESLRGTMTNTEISGTFSLRRTSGGGGGGSASTSPALQAIVGEWRSTGSDTSRWRFSWDGSTLIWEADYGEGWFVRTRQRASVKASGFIGFEPVEGNAFEITGDRLWLHYDDGTRTPRQTEMVRVR